MMLAFALALAASGALADDVEDAHRLALQGCDSYWNCLALRVFAAGYQGHVDAGFFTSISPAPVRPNGSTT